VSRVANSRAAESRRDASRSAPRARVLVVDDEDYVRDSLLAVLGARGYAAVGASSVAEAMALLSKMPVDVVLSDLRMPESDGLDLLRRLQASSPDTPVVILTGHGTVVSAVACLKAGASDYILKPADPEAIEVAFALALDKAGRSIPARMAMIAMTTSNSMRVNPLLF